MRRGLYYEERIFFRDGGTLALASVDVILAVEDVTLWKALGRARCREGCFGRVD